jgi:aspartate kinase
VVGNAGNTPRTLNVTVAKVGGSLLRPGEVDKVLGKVVERHLADDGKLVIVVSAMKGVTDTLIRAYDEGEPRLIEDAIQPYLTEAQRLSLGKLGSVIEGIGARLKGLVSIREPWARDYVIVHGELLSTMLAEAALYNSLGVDAGAVYDAGIVTNEDWGRASVLGVSSHYVRHRLTWALLRRSVVVVPGFLGMSINGRLTSLGRGGSDYTASLIASYLNAPRLIFYTDVEGIMTGDPRIISDARLVPSLTHEEAYVASLTGAKKFHPGTFKPLIDSDIQVTVTNPWSSSGTLIMSRCVNTPKLVSISETGSIGLVNLKNGYAVTVVGCVMGLDEFRREVYLIISSYGPIDVINDTEGNAVTSIVKDQDVAVKLAKELHRWVVSWIR